MGTSPVKDIKSKMKTRYCWQAVFAQIQAIEFGPDKPPEDGKMNQMTADMEIRTLAF